MAYRKKGYKRRYKKKYRGKYQKKYGSGKTSYQRGYQRKEGNYGRFASMPSAGGELKYFDAQLGSDTSITVMAPTGTILMSSLNLIVQGTGNNQMLGRKVTITKISVRATVVKGAAQDAVGTWPATIAGSANYRLALVLDKQCNGAAATAAQIYDVDGSGSVGIFSMNKLEYSQRFQILKTWEGSFNCDILPVMNSITNFVNWNTSDMRRYVDDTINKEIDLEFSTPGTPGTRVISEIRSNNLLLVGFSSGSQCGIAMNARIRFKDA